MAITAVSPDNAWAIGMGNISANGVGTALILHWNGKAWRQAPGVPDIVGVAEAVTATAHDVWIAVDTFSTAVAFLHLTGGRWYVVPSSEGLEGPNVYSIAVVSPQLAWAGGLFGGGQDFLLRWNGSVWKLAPSPFNGEEIEGMAVGPRGTVWAVGNDNPNNGISGEEAASMRWNSKSWQKVPVGIPDAVEFTAVGFSPDGTPWAAAVMPS
jgi:hypothetical protein